MCSSAAATGARIGCDDVAGDEMAAGHLDAEIANMGGHRRFHDTGRQRPV
jgi:hypothetical protein